jgi:hypothetical protein
LVLILEPDELNQHPLSSRSILISSSHLLLRFTNYLLLGLRPCVIFRKRRAVAQAVSRWLPTAAARVASGVCDGQSGTGADFFPTTSVSPANHNSINLSNIIINRGWHNRRIGGRRAEWTQLDRSPCYGKFY